MDAGTRPVDDLDSGAPVSPSDAGVGTDSGTPKTVSCPATATPASSGETRATLQQDGRMRAYLTYIPIGYDPARPWPLVLNFHGATMTAEQQRDFSGMNAAADAKGFVVVYPQGVGNSWNAGACCGEAQTSNVDDVGFVRELVAAVQASVCIDPDRVYASGFSNGGRMT
jgi:polyhydroxybutyrate depolymerase